MNKIKKPTYTKPIPEFIPEVMTGYKQWVMWKAVWKDEKWTKVPYDPKTQKVAKTNDRRTWSDFKTACEASRNGHFDGIGFVLTKDDPFTGFDFDHCVDTQSEKGGITAPFDAYIDLIGGYTEYSPSGKGIRIATCGKLPEGHSCRKGSQVEVYTSGRYLTFTGAVLDGRSALPQDSTQQINEFYNSVFNAKPHGDPAKSHDDEKNRVQDPVRSSFISDPKTKKLFDGDTSGYASQSEADLALCSLIAKRTKDPQHIDRTFRKSALYRDKWDKKHFSTGQTYGEHTIEKALSGSINAGKTSDRNLSQAIRDYVDIIEGIFSTRELYDDLNIRNPAEKTTARVVLKHLCDTHIIERQKRQVGTYRKVQTELKRIDLLKASTETVDLWLPLGIHNMVTFHPGNTVLVAGDSNVGKTAFLLNIAKENLSSFKIHYFSSEMGADEMSVRINLFGDFPRTHKNFNPYERNDDFADVIVPGKGNLNIIDYLEIVDEFYMIGKYLKDIHHKLDGALAVVAVQKRHPTSDDPLGGKRGLEKPRLVLSMRAGIIKIVKAKNWATGKNPNRLQASFKLVQGSKFSRQGGWEIPDKDEK